MRLSRVPTDSDVPRPPALTIVSAVTAASNSESSSMSSLQNQGRQLAFEETEVVEVGENESPKPVKKKADHPKKVLVQAL